MTPRLGRPRQHPLAALGAAGPHRVAGRGPDGCLLRALPGLGPPASLPAFPPVPPAPSSCCPLCLGTRTRACLQKASCKGVACNVLTVLGGRKLSPALCVCFMSEISLLLLVQSVTKPGKGLLAGIPRHSLERRPLECFLRLPDTSSKSVVPGPPHSNPKQPISLTFFQGLVIPTAMPPSMPLPVPFPLPGMPLPSPAQPMQILVFSCCPVHMPPHPGSLP